MAWQLRMYRVQKGRLDDFVKGWRSGVLPLRRQLGFEVAGAWSIPDEDRFVWIIGYDGPEGFAAKNEEYYASPQRAVLDPDPAALLDQVEQWMITPISLQ